MQSLKIFVFSTYPRRLYSSVTCHDNLKFHTLFLLDTHSTVLYFSPYYFCWGESKQNSVPPSTSLTSPDVGKIEILLILEIILLQYSHLIMVIFWTY